MRHPPFRPETLTVNVNLKIKLSLASAVLGLIKAGKMAWYSLVGSADHDGRSGSGGVEATCVGSRVACYGGDDKPALSRRNNFHAPL